MRAHRRNGARSVMRRLAAAGVTASMLSGCLFPAMGPNYKRPRVPLPNEWRVEASEAADIANTEWWKSLGDEDLNKLIGQALVSNSDILIAAARIEEYDGKLETANSQYFPQLGYDIGFEKDTRSQEVPELLRIGQPITFNQYRYNATISYEFDLWGRVRRSYEAARAQLLATKDARRTVTLTVVTTVASTYMQLLEADRQLEIAKQTLASFADTVALSDKKYHGGSGTDIDVARARAQYEAQAALIPDVERSIAFLEDSLTTLVGGNPGSVPRGHLDKLVLMTVPGGIPADVLTRRPDVLAAENNLIAANAGIGIAKTGYFPSFSLTSSYGQSSDQTAYLLAKTARTGILAIDLIGPIFNFGKTQGDVRRARAITKGQQQAYVQTIQIALREVNDALVYNQKSKERVAALDRHVAAVKEADRLAKLRLAGGSYTDLDVFDADRQVLASQNAQIHGVLDQYLALVSVFKAMGGGWMIQQEKSVAAAGYDVHSGSATADAQIASATKEVAAK